MIRACRWLLPIDRAPIEHAWIETAGGLIRRVGQGTPPRPAVDLGNVALLPGLVNAHTHLELSWMAGRVPPAGSFDAWVRSMMTIRRAGPSGGADDAAVAAVDAARVMTRTGTVLVGDISNSLLSPGWLAAAGLGGVVFHELLGFNAADPAALVTDASIRVVASVRAVGESKVPLKVHLSAHAPYSVSAPLFRAIAERETAALTVHLGESAEEIEFLRTGRGPLRRMLGRLGAWNPAWEPPMSGPVAYLRDLEYIRRGTLVVHAVHLVPAELEALREAGAVVVTCPRSNLWVGAGMPRVSQFYASGVPVAIGTDSLASVASLNLFDELKELRRIAPDVAAASLLESATRVGAEALGFGASHGTIAPGKSDALVAVDLPSDVGDVEEYLVGGVPAGAIRPVS